MGRLVLKADFERVLSAPPRVRSTHFVVHHLPVKPGRAGLKSVDESKLSTLAAPCVSDDVDKSIPSQGSASTIPAISIWLGTIVPKRLARRSVTRTLIKRQIRAAVERRSATLPAGLWVVRLRAPFEIARFPSAASDALRRAAREELDATLERAAQPR